VNYVLNNFNEEEKEPVNLAILNAAEAVKLYTTIGPAHTMTKVNA
jgi:peptidyl-tRNA hydrolase